MITATGTITAKNLIKVEVLQISLFRNRVLVQVTVGEDVRPPKWLKKDDYILQSLYFKAG